MLQNLNTPLGLINLYSVLPIIGSIVSVLVQMFLLFKYGKKVRYILFSALYGFYSVVGNYLGSFVRVITYGSNRKRGMLESVTGNYGKHFIGTVIFIAVFAGICTYVLYKVLLKKTESWEKTFFVVTDALSVGFLIQHIFGRFGCFFNGCCYGNAYEGFGAMRFPYSDVSYKVFPSQLFEIILTSFLLLLIIILIIKNKHIFGIALSGFAVIIFLSEIWIDKKGTRLFYGFSVIQFFAILLLALGIIHILYAKKLEKGL